MPAHHSIPPTEGSPVSPARAAVDIITLTVLDDFLLELGSALGGQASITPVESTAQAIEQLSQSKRLKILAIDSRGLDDIRAEVDAIQARISELTVLIFAEEHAEAQIAGAVKGSEVFAVLPLPVDARKTLAIFGGALAESKAKRTPPQSALMELESVPAISAPSLANEPIRPQPREEKPKSPLLAIGGGLALAILAAAALWFFTRDGSSPPAATAEIAKPAAPVEAQPAIETSLVKGKVDELLEKARQAMRERRYTEPAGDNALLYYRSAMAADSGSGEALDGLTRVGSVLAARFEEAVAANHYDEAAIALAQFKSAVPADARGTAFQTQLTKWRAETVRQQEEARAKRLAEEKAEREEAAAAELKKARDARAASAEADRLAQIAREKAQAEEQKKAEQAAKEVKNTSGAPQNSTPAQRPSSGSLQSSLKRKRYVAPDYPQDALAKGLGGTVTIVFTVDVRGETQDIRVESAEPPGMFDKAAIAAIKRWRYEPLLVDGVPTEVPARMTIRFAPPK